MMRYLPVDVALRETAFMQFVGGNIGNLISTIEFQFPPKITSDNRKGDWEEGEQPGTEPIAAYKKSGAREITFTTTYVVDGGIWTTTKIATIVKSLRGYFARARLLSDHRNLIVMFKMWGFGGQNPMSCRFKDIDVKYSDAVVAPCGRPNEAFALKTDITISLRLWTRGGAEQTQNLVGLRPDEEVNWY